MDRGNLWSRNKQKLEICEQFIRGGGFCVVPLMLNECLSPQDRVTKLMATQWSVTSFNHSLGNQIFLCCTAHTGLVLFSQRKCDKTHGNALSFSIGVSKNPTIFSLKNWISAIRNRATGGLRSPWPGFEPRTLDQFTNGIQKCMRFGDTLFSICISADASCCDQACVHTVYGNKVGSRQIYNENAELTSVRPSEFNVGCYAICK